MTTSRHSTTALAFAAATLAAAAAQPATAAKAELHVEAATHAMPGMGGLGALGRITGNMSGGNASYGQARHPGMPGRYLDIALDNDYRPGAPAVQAVPKDLRLGKSIDLIAPERRVETPSGSHDATGALGIDSDGKYEIRYYWGCGESAGKGQPRKVTTTIRNGKASTSGSAPAPRAVPQLGLSADPRYSLWPNQASRKAVSNKASLVGSHRVTADSLPEAIEFNVDRAQDFMPEITLRSRGSAADGISLEWNAVEGAKAWFIHAMGMDGDTIVMWSSAGDGYAGPEMLAYLPANTVSQWLGKRTLLSPETRSCSIPKGIFAGDPMVQMIAYGGSRTIEGKDWRVHLRTKSTTMLMGSAMGAGLSGDSAKDADKEAGKDAAKGVLRGLLRR